MQKFSKFILRVFGWKSVITVEELPKSVICVAPHTSNWDFILGKFFYWSANKHASFLMKKSWFFFPISLILKSMGGVPVDRSKSMSVTDQVTKMFEENEQFHIAITPEGTRSLRKKWKMGFYHIAIKANVPIQLAYLDYKKKEMGITEIFYPTGDMDADLKYIRAFYKNITPKFPEKFYIEKE